MKNVIVILLTVLVLGCGSIENISKSAVDRVGDEEIGVWCTAVCLNLQRMHCPGGELKPGDDGLIGTDDDTGCMTACQGGAYGWFNLACLAATSCIDAEEFCPLGQ